MEMLEKIVAALATIITSLGGAAVISIAVAKRVSDHASARMLQAHKGALDKDLESHKSQLSRETETHKLKLKREELFFQREIEAAQAYMRLWRAVWPQHSRPDMDWHDACIDVASELGRHEKALADFLEDHAIGVSEAVRTDIQAAKDLAASEKFFVEEVGLDPPQEAIDAAGKILDLLRKAKDQILLDLRR